MGTYTQAFIAVQDSQNHSAPLQPTLTIIANSNPIVSCTASPNPASPGQTVTFSATASGGTPGYTYAWSGAISGSTQSVSFPANTIGAFSATVALHDSAGGTNSATCSLTVQPATTTPATMISPTPGSTLTSNSATFSWGNASGVSQYALTVGSNPSGSDLYNANTGLTTYAIVPGLPTDGRALYVTLSSFIAGRWTPVSYTYHASSTPSSLPIIPSPYSATLAPPTPASFTITLNPSAGLSGTVAFTVSGLPPQAGFSFNPPTLNGSGVTDLTITPGLSSPTGTYAVQVSALSGSAEAATIVTLNIVASSPAKILSPPPGATLIQGSVATFTWTAGMGATQYQFSLGTTPGGSNVFSPVTGAAQSVTADDNCDPTQVLYATVGSLINGVWQNTSYAYDCSPNPIGPPGPVPPAPRLLLVSSVPNVVNSGREQLGGTYQIYDANHQIYLDPSQITWIAAEWLPGSGQSGDDPNIGMRISGINGSTFTLTFKPTTQTVPGGRTLDIGWNGFGVSTFGQTDLQIYDNTPAITSVSPSAIAPGQTNVPLIISGTNFGPQPGSIAFCVHVDPPTTAPCATTSDISLASPPSSAQWIDTPEGSQVTVMVNTVANPTQAVYDVILTSGGESPVSLGGLGFLSDQQTGQTTSPNSNRQPLNVPTVSLTSYGWSVGMCPSQSTGPCSFNLWRTNPNWITDKMADEGATQVNYQATWNASPPTADPVVFVAQTVPALSYINLAANGGLTAPAKLCVTTNQPSQSFLVLSDPSCNTTIDIQFTNGVATYSFAWNSQQALPSAISNLNATLTWSISFNGGQTWTRFATTQQTFFVTLSFPAGFAGNSNNAIPSEPHLTAARLNYVTNSFSGLTSQTNVATRARGNVLTMFGFGNNNMAGSNPWANLDNPSAQVGFDCISLTLITVVQVLQVGANAALSYAFATSDADASVKESQDSGDQILEFLVGSAPNGFEAFFLLNTGGILGANGTWVNPGTATEAHTVAPSAGPLSPSQYSLQAGLTPAQALAFSVIFQTLTTLVDTQPPPSGQQWWYFADVDGNPIGSMISQVPFPIPIP